MDHTGPWTEDDFHRLPTGIRAELHNGSLILTASPDFEHQHAQRMIAMRLAEALRDMKRVAEASDVRMADVGGTVRPTSSRYVAATTADPPTPITCC